MKTNTIEDVLARLRVNEVNGCWEWPGCVDKGGYGRVRFQGRDLFVHCLIWLKRRGPVLNGLQLDHLCRNPRCANPDHLEPVTPKENTRRGRRANAEKMQCPAGHAYTKENISYDYRGWRKCRTCKRERMRRVRAQSVLSSARSHDLQRT